MGLFSAMKDASYSQSGTYMTPNCSYVLRLVSVVQGQKKTTQEDYVVATFEVLETDAANKIGSEVSYFVGNSGASKLNFLGNVKKLVVAVCGSLAGKAVDPSQVGEDETVSLFEPSQPGAMKGTLAAGVVVRCRTKAVKTRAGGDFTVHDFEPVFTQAA